MLVTCKLFQKPYSEKLFKDDYVKISEFYSKVNNEVVLLYKKYMDNEELTNREQVLLFKYLISCLSSNNPAFQNIFQNVVKRILGNKQQTKSRTFYHDGRQSILQPLLV